eukprot:m.26219 g.26219  ORF g.26219 m.26219 type:complete len:51 (+) comp38318_c0_seq1:15-167(+)
MDLVLEPASDHAEGVDEQNQTAPSRTDATLVDATLVDAILVDAMVVLESA